MPSTIKMAVASATFVFALAFPAIAQELTIAPISATLAKSERVAVFTVANNGNDLVSLQVRPFLWTQAGGVDAFTPSSDIVASPPLANVPPGQTQVIRVVVHRLPAQGETAYRLIIDQLPVSLKAGAVARGGISMTFRYSIPVFAESASVGAADLSGVLNPDGTLVLYNHGSRHIKVGSPKVNSSQTVIADGTPYVLAGGERTWRVRGRVGAAGGTVPMTAMTDGGTLRLNLLLAGR